MHLLKQLLQYFISTFFSLSLLALFALGGIYLYYTPQIPDSTELRKIEMQVPLRIYSREQRLIAEYGTMRRETLKFHEIPKKVTQAFIAIEDSRFYEHRGIDPKGILRALYSVLSTGRASQGASTITMQLARNVFFDNQKTLDRKLKETLLALKIEETLSKQEILELYLNKIFLGHRSYGIGAAARTYYGKSLDELNLAQVAMIAGLPKAPSAYNPVKNPQRALVRRNYILKRMLEQHYIQPNEYETARKAPITAQLHKPDIETQAPYLAEMVRAEIVEKFGKQAAYTQGYHVYTTLDSQLQQHATAALRSTLQDYDRRHGYRGPEAKINLRSFSDHESLISELASYPDIADLHAALVLESNRESAQLLTISEEKPITLKLSDVKWARTFKTADSRGAKPKAVSQVMQAGDIVRIRKNEKGQWQFTQVPRLGGAVVLMDSNDGAIRALSGGFDFKHSKFNRAIQAKRQPGSTFKPFLYAAALNKGFSPTSIINDAPITFPGSDWKPQNYGGKYIGPTTLAEALAKSRNLVSIRLMRRIGVHYTIDYATRFGFPSDRLPKNLTLSLGTGITTPLENATAYASLSNGGYKVENHFITRIEDSQGNTVYEANPDLACGDNRSFCPQEQQTTKNRLRPQPAATRIMNAKTHAQIIQMLQGVTQFGTAAKAGRTLKRKDIAGKTGTTNDQKDAWFCGVTPDYVAVTWAGFDDMKELGNRETATKVALPMWIALMEPTLKEKPEVSWKVPESLQLAGKQPVIMDQANQQNTHESTQFEYKTMPVATEQDNFYNATAQHHKPAPSLPQAEAVEIPEQIF